MDEPRPIAITSDLPPDHLTPRQREVVVLIAEGLTNAEIGQRLTITPGTAANHVEAMLRRLDVRSRVQAAMWAVAHGLVVVSPPPSPGARGNGADEAAL